MAGRKPKPRRLKLLTGNPGKRALGGAEPEPPAGKITRPEFLKYREAEIWDEHASGLIAMGTLTTVDVPTFAVWCVLWAEFEKKGADMQASQVSQMRLLAASLGMDASSRAKIGSAGGQKPKDPADEFFEGKKSG